MRRNKTKGYSILCSTKQSIYVLGYREGTFHDKLNCTPNYDEQNYPLEKFGTINDKLLYPKLL